MSGHGRYLRAHARSLLGWLRASPGGAAPLGARALARDRVVVLAPAIGGLLYGPLIGRFAPGARGHGVPLVMLAVAERGGRISPKVAVVKSLASSICIGSGGSVGREGTIVQTGPALGSTIGQLVRVPRLFAVGRAGLSRGGRRRAGGLRVSPVPPLAGFHLVSLGEDPLYAGLGVLTALGGVTFIHVLYAIEDICDRVWPWSNPLRPVSAARPFLLVRPAMYGVEYPCCSARSRAAT